MPKECTYRFGLDFTISAVISMMPDALPTPPSVSKKTYFFNLLLACLVESTSLRGLKISVPP